MTMPPGISQDATKSASFRGGYPSIAGCPGALQIEELVDDHGKASVTLHSYTLFGIHPSQQDVMPAQIDPERMVSPKAPRVFVAYAYARNQYEVLLLLRSKIGLQGLFEENGLLMSVPESTRNISCCPYQMSTAISSKFESDPRPVGLLSPEPLAPTSHWVESPPGAQPISSLAPIIPTTFSKARPESFKSCENIGSLKHSLLAESATYAAA
ncbi:hypothetical protein DL98DRAFT_538395 [Cadophora sp. DSE1049]|nr:hypothetical protein DL98DRAFT_538395 [Cadophora sp. DSE1049]